MLFELTGTIKLKKYISNYRLNDDKSIEIIDTDGVSQILVEGMLKSN